MTKLLYIIGSLLMLLTVTVTGVLAFIPEAIFHTHEYASEVTKEATCTLDGETTFTCGCGDSYTEKIPAFGHTEEALAGKAATCTEAGLTDGSKCTACDETLVKQEEIPALGHDIVVDEAKAPTCTEVGLTKGEGCSRCDYTVSQEEIPALGHDIVVDEAKAPTCNDTGLTAGEHCTKCDYKVEQEIVDALGHDIKILAALKPTCTDTGLTQGYYCARCDGYNIKQDLVPALGHSYDNDDDTTCNACDHVRTPACKHPNTEAIGTPKDATCTENGITAGIICCDCGEIVNPQEIIEKLGHNIVNYEAKDPTCTEAGHNAHEACTRCDYTTGEEIPALGHDIVVDEAKAPTCTETGLTAGEHCTKCDHKVEQTVVDALGHKEVIDAGISVKCFTDGITEGKHCSVCEEILIKQEVLKAPGAHNWNGTSCTVCHATKFEAETFEILNKTTDKNMVGSEGKKPADVYYPSGDAFVFNLQYAPNATLRFSAYSSADQTAVMTFRMGRRQYAVKPSDIFILKVNGEEVAFNSSEFSVETDSSLRYYDWVEIAVATIKLNEGDNVIELVRLDNDRGLNFDYVSICPEEGNTILDSRERTNGHSYTNWEFAVEPNYTTAGSASAYCDYCRSFKTVELPVVSAENGYVQLSYGVKSVWKYTTSDNVEVVVEVHEEAKKFSFLVTDDDDIFTNVVDNNGPEAATGRYTNKNKNNYGIFYELTQGATFTIKVNASQATEAVLVLVLRGNSGGEPYAYQDVIKSVSVTSGGNTTNGVISDDGVVLAGWKPENNTSAEVAVINLKEGENIISFTMGDLNINIAGFEILAFAEEVTHQPTKIVYGGNIADFDPFVKENGGSFVKGTGATAKVTDATNGVYYQKNNTGATFTMTVTVDHDMTVVFYLGLTAGTSAGYKATTGEILTSITSTDSAGGENTVVRFESATTSFKGWNANTNTVKLGFATISLKEGTNTITFVFGSKNINIAAVYLHGTEELIIGKNELE